MKTFTCLFYTALAFVMSCASEAAQVDTVLPPSAATVMISITDNEPDTTVQFAAVPDQWVDIKDCTSEMRGAFFVGFENLEGIVNHQLDELAAQRTLMKNPAEIKVMDAAIQNMGNARFFLTVMAGLLSKSTPHTWNQQKLKVGLAWEKTQEIFAAARIRNFAG